MYRDRFNGCPRCGGALVQYDVRQKWRCKTCMGGLLGPDELQGDLGLFQNAFTVTGTPSQFACPACGTEMQRIRMRGIELDRCEQDRHIWFDGGELGRIRKSRADAEVEADMKSVMTALLFED